MRNFSFYINPETGEPHILDHQVYPEEIVEFFEDTDILERKRKDGSLVAYGILKSGRILTVVYRKTTPDHYFVITAYDLEDKEILQYIIGVLE